MSFDVLSYLMGRKSGNGKVSGEKTNIIMLTLEVVGEVATDIGSNEYTVLQDAPTEVIEDPPVETATEILMEEDG